MMFDFDFGDLMSVILILLFVFEVFIVMVVVDGMYVESYGDYEFIVE